MKQFLVLFMAGMLAFGGVFSVPKITAAGLKDNKDGETSDSSSSSSSSDDKPRRILIQLKEKRTTPNGSQLSTFDVEKLKKGETLKKRLKEIRKDPLVLRAAPNYTREMVEVTPNDPEYQNQYHVDQTDSASIDVGKAWSVTTGKKKVVIAVIDTGVDLDHADLKDKMWKNEKEVSGNGVDDDGNGFIDDVNGWDFYENNNNPNPKPCSSGSNGGVVHGTHVAGIAAGKTNNAVGIAGVGWKTKIMALKVANCEGTMSDDDIAPAIEYAVNNGAKIINMSLAGIGYSSVLDSVVQEARAKGVTIVAAAGNYGRNLNRIPAYPVCSEGVIGVAATDETDQIADFSNFGDECVDVSAPGVNILSTLYHDPNNPEFTAEYGLLSGTSMATPVVAGLTSLLIAQEADLTPDEVLATVRNTVENIGASTSYGTGKVNALQAILSLESVNDVHITAFNNSDKKTEFKNNTRQKDKAPYFTWVVPELLNAEIEGYYMYFGKKSDADPVKDGTFTTKTAYQVPSKLSDANEQKYFLKIAVQTVGGGIYADRGSFTYILDTIIAETPDITQLKENGDAVTLEWKEVADEHVTKYDVRRTLKGEGEFTTIASVSAETFVYSDTSAASGKTYVYKIRAVDNLGNKSVSAEKTISVK